MNFKALLLERKSVIRKKWFDAILANYPPDAAIFFKKQKDAFRNPVGNTIFQCIKELYEEILYDAGSEKVYPYLNDIIKIKAVQEFSPSQAVSFIYLLRNVVREELEGEVVRHGLSDEMRSFENQMDALALLCFDIYMKCRETIFDIRVNEVKTMTSRLLKMANIVYEITDKPDSAAEKVLTQNIKG
jgi:hypothetical protein